MRNAERGIEKMGGRRSEVGGRRSELGRFFNEECGMKLLLDH